MVVLLAFLMSGQKDQENRKAEMGRRSRGRDRFWSATIPRFNLGWLRETARVSYVRA
jgi:hypothetical protein